MSAVIRLTIKRAAQLGIRESELNNCPNFSATGSVKGMKALYYGDDAKLIQYRGYVYKVPIALYEKASR